MSTFRQHGSFKPIMLLSGTVDDCRIPCQFSNNWCLGSSSLTLYQLVDGL